MHYRNGREAKAGDAILSLQSGKTGILYDNVAGVKQCSARLASTSQSDEYLTVAQCLHLDDVASPQSVIPDSTAIPDALPTPSAEQGTA